MSKLSIITVNLNNASGLQKTMESVLEQTFTDFEYIVIDGESADGSKEIIEKYIYRLSYWISEKDNGIYNAMNKGILKAKGEYLLFLNSGDFLINKDAVEQLYTQSEGLDIVYGDLRIDNKTNPFVRTFPEKLSFSFFLESTLPHQSSFIKRDLFDRVGLYNENLRSTSDWEFFMNAICKHNATYKYVPIVLTCFNTDGIASQAENWVWIQEDKKQVLEKSYPAFIDDYSRLKRLEGIDRELRNIQNSKIWKLRNKIIHSILGRLIFKNKQ